MSWTRAGAGVASRPLQIPVDQGAHRQQQLAQGLQEPPLEFGRNQLANGAEDLGQQFEIAARVALAVAGRHLPPGRRRLGAVARLVWRLSLSRPLSRPGTLSLLGRLSLSGPLRPPGILRSSGRRRSRLGDQPLGRLGGAIEPLLEPAHAAYSIRGRPRARAVGLVRSIESHLERAVLEVAAVG